MARIATRAYDNNLKLNSSKSLEMILRWPRAPKVATPIPIQGINRVKALNILGVTIQDTLSMCGHVSDLVSCAGQNLCALKTLKAHGLSSQMLSDVCRATLASRLAYAALALWGFTSIAEQQQLDAVLRKRGDGTYTTTMHLTS
jgi:hypothetical protein